MLELYLFRHAVDEGNGSVCGRVVGRGLYRVVRLVNARVAQRYLEHVVAGLIDLHHTVDGLGNNEVVLLAYVVELSLDPLVLGAQVADAGA